MIQGYSNGFIALKSIRFSRSDFDLVVHSGLAYRGSFNGHSLRSGRIKRARELGRFAVADAVGEAFIPSTSPEEIAPLA